MTAAQLNDARRRVTSQVSVVGLSCYQGGRVAVDDASLTNAVGDVLL